MNEKTILNLIFQFVIVNFGITNDPSPFLMTYVFPKYLNVFVMWYDDLK
jgi:hypothetical protein